MRKIKLLNGSFVALCLFFISFMMINITAKAQDENSSEKKSISMNMSYKVVNGIKTIKVSVDTKVDGKREPVSNLIVNLYLNEIKKYDTTTTTGWMGNVVTNSDGVGEFKFSELFNERTKNIHEFHFIATSHEDLRYEDAEAETYIYDIFLKLNVTTEDSISTATATLVKLVDGKEVPIPDAEVKLFAARTFGAFPFGEEGMTTDSFGVITAEVPNDIIGTADKKLTIIARYDDPENDGKFEATQTIPWTVLPYENEEMTRSLWSTAHNAPIPLVITSVSIIALIWGIIVYLVLLLPKIKKAGKKSI